MDAIHPDFQSVYSARQSEYIRILQGQPSRLALELMSLLGASNGRAVVVYPEAVHWEPQQRPHHWLREMARRGYLCFFCDPAEGESGLREIEPRLFALRGGQGDLLHALRSQSAIVLCTWMMQMAWADLLPHKIVWYDLLDSLEFFSLYDDNMLAKHRQLVRSADIVTYSARSLERFLENRPDALHLPNAAFPEHFAGGPERLPPESDDAPPCDLEPIAACGCPIIGYFGALEEWFDAETIGRIASRRPEWQFVLIGKGPVQGRIRSDNVHFLGFKEYERISAYGRFFHVGIIPFTVNGMTDCVSPVKFFEYAALGLPVVSTSIAEMIPYRSEWVRIADGADAFEAAIEQALKPDVRRLAKEEGAAFASRQQWGQRFELVQRRFDELPKVWQAFANDRPAGKVAVMAATFLDFEGERFYSGGAERYLLDLSRLCRRIGLELVIYQYGNYAWRRRFQGVEVISLSRGGQHARQLSVATVRIFSRLFREQTDGRAVLAVFSAYFNAWPHGSGCPSIGIVHGVGWDDPGARFEDGIAFWERNRRFIEGAKSCGSLVSVDTNSANWFQTIDYELGRGIRVIPNYVEIAEFTPRPDYTRTGDRIVILYPRRLYSPRGLFLTLDIVDRILERYPQVDFHFVGNGEAADTSRVDEKREKWGDRIRRYNLPMEEMAKAYRNADISLIPTLHSEGTSLSCLEAMACGNAVIATRIGGLSDLVIHDHNGLLIEPDAESLHEAIRELLDRPAKLAALKRQAVKVAKTFSKQRWERNWLTVLEKALGGKREGRVRNDNADGGQWIEIYLAETPKPNPALGSLVLNFLERGDTVVLRMKNFVHKRIHSFGRLQWMDWGDRSFSEPDWVFAGRSVLEEVRRPVDAVWDEEGEWEWISSSRPSPIERDRRSSSASSTNAQGR
ncbi:glycosyltransferase [Cohnella zeiphila]|uniref:Glycosyltransferase n=1 Tax=Cohnella zeiphila TaxID=2761120 RepID=A0A7X0SQN8_9BACL|nr:glycosyltransferase [Cohnella zeiphila]MBB6734367.1 glycosyltransferase [Cohnella zeiphila]